MIAHGAHTDAHSGTAPESRPRIGVSACLVGQNVRYDGGHKLCRFVTHVLAPHVALVPVCPEVEIGLGTPRPPIRLVEDDGRLRLEQVDSSRDLTESMLDYTSRRLAEFAKFGLSGYIFKSRSPTCGLHDVPIHAVDGTVLRSGAGLYSERFLESFSDVPVEEETRLEDPGTRDHFLTRVFAHHRLHAFEGRRGTRADPSDDLLHFHRRESFLLFVHDPDGAAELDGDVTARQENLASYANRFLRIVRKPPEKSRHVEALRRLAACVAGLLTRSEVDSVRAEIESFEAGRSPRSAPSASIQRLAERHDLASVYTQTYLAPHPLAG